MKKISSFLWIFIFGLPVILSMSFLIWFLLLTKPERTRKALRELAKNLKG